MDPTATYVLGASLALGVALFVALQVICIRVGSQDGGVSDGLAITMVLNVVIFLPVALVFAYPHYGLTGRSLAAFLGAGLLGTFVARALWFVSIERIGGSRTEPVKASMPLFASLIAIGVLGETLSLFHGVGIVLIVLGVAVISWEITSSDAAHLSDVDTAALALPLAAACFFAVEPTLVKIGLAEDTPILVGVTLKSVGGGVGFLAYLAYRNDLPTRRILDAPNTRWYVAAGLCNTVSVIAYYAALDLSNVVVVAPISQTSPLFVAALGYVFFPTLERITPRLVTASTIVVAGAVLVTVMG